jgi:methionyl-tRNA formyltransferase
MAPTPVATAAAAFGLAARKVERIRAVEEELRAADLDFLLVADFGEIIPSRVFDLPRRGAFNVHGSLLPRWRGAAPCAWALRAGDTVTGCTIFRLVRELDAGPILCQRQAPILPTDTAGSLEERLAGEAAPLIAVAVALLAVGAYELREQDASAVTFAPKLTKADGALPWHEDAPSLERHVRAMQPWPRAYAFLEGRGGVAPLRLNVLRAEVASGDGAAGAAPGVVCAVAADAIDVACGGGSVLRLRELQPAGRTAMTAADFLRGRRIEPGDRFVPAPAP